MTEERLVDRIAAALRRLPPDRQGFEARTRIADWVLLNLWPIGTDLEPVIRQRAEDIALSILESRALQPRRAEITPRPHARDALPKIGRRYAALARQHGDEADWRLLLFKLRCEVKRTRLGLHRVTKLEIVKQLADVYFEITGRRPGLSYNGRATHFERLGDAIFDGKPWRSIGKRACLRFYKKVGNQRAPD